MFTSSPLENFPVMGCQILAVIKVYKLGECQTLYSLKLILDAYRDMKLVLLRKNFLKNEY